MTFLRLDHTAVAVKSLDEAIPRYQRLYSVKAGERALVESQAVEVAFLRFGDTTLELISPSDKSSGVWRFIERGGERLHHVAFQVDSIVGELERLRSMGVGLIDQEPRPGLHGKVAFVHPRGMGGVLVELLEDEAR